MVIESRAVNGDHERKINHKMGTEYTDVTIFHAGWIIILCRTIPSPSKLSAGGRVTAQDVLTMRGGRGGERGTNIFFNFDC